MVKAGYIYMDLSKAFDTVSPSVLVQKVKACKVLRELIRLVYSENSVILQDTWD